MCGSLRALQSLVIGTPCVPPQTLITGHEDRALTGARRSARLAYAPSPREGEVRGNYPLLRTAPRATTPSSTAATFMFNSLCLEYNVIEPVKRGTPERLWQRLPGRHPDHGRGGGGCDGGLLHALSGSGGRPSRSPRDSARRFGPDRHGPRERDPNRRPRTERDGPRLPPEPPRPRGRHRMHHRDRRWDVERIHSEPDHGLEPNPRYVHHRLPDAGHRDDREPIHPTGP